MRDINTFWIARLYCTLELPDYWRLNYENERDGLFYTPPNNSIKIFTHPSFYYVETLLEIAKNSKDYEEITLPSVKMTFYDQFNREYEIEIKELVNDMRDGRIINKLMKYTKIRNDCEDEEELDSVKIDDEQSEQIWKQEITRFKEKLLEKSINFFLN